MTKPTETDKAIQIGTPIITEREARMKLLTAQRAARPAWQKNDEADITIGDTQCLARVKLEDGETVKYCASSEGHERVMHITHGGVAFTTAS